jgi:hypothetical protein
MTPFDPEALRPMLIARNGDVRAVAKEIDADSEELRNYILSTPLLRRALDEVVNRGVDQSLAVLFDGLNDSEHFMNQLAAAKEFLKTRPAQRRGFNHHAGDLELKMPAKGGALTLTWLPPEDPSAGSGQALPPMIEGKVEDE